jgi:hypothetical protein
METWSAKPQLWVLLDHLATIKDTQQSWKVANPLREVLLLVVCGTIACGDDYEDIVEWGEAHLSFFSRVLGVLPRHSLRRLAAGCHEPDRSRPVRSLLFVLGRRMLAQPA